MPFEINTPDLAGAITTAYLIEHDGVDPLNIIGFDQDFDAHIEWYLCGPFPPPGDWVLRFHLESIGGGPEYDLPLAAPDRVPIDSGVACDPGPAGDCLCWEHNIEVAAGTVAPGTYKGVVVLTWEEEPGNPGPMAGFADLDLLQVYVH